MEPKKAVQSDIKWSLSNESVVKIADGKLVAVNPGSATLTATLGAIKLDIPVTVQYKVLKLTASEKKYVLVAGQEVSVPTVKAQMAGGGTLDVTNQVSWVATTAAVTVGNGKVKAVSGGNSGIKAMYLNKYVKVPVIVEGTISTLTPSLSSAEMNLKGSQSVKVIGAYTDGKKSYAQQQSEMDNIQCFRGDCKRLSHQSGWDWNSDDYGHIPE
ncbi:hypothetical protein [Paenibacillus sp. RC343]|uniref:hypothetical protein n=1 Tax=Paenibacillus sp. RC343 TaxID=3045841 RepID=UPI0024B9F737|nr:hypothetical protein [Paenibacillus sp. RC343]